MSTDFSDFWKGRTPFDFNETDEERWRSRAASHFRRKRLREWNDHNPKAPRCAGCEGIVRGRDITDRSIVLGAGAKEFFGGEYEQGDVFCFFCWCDYEMADIGSRFRWGHC